MTPENKNINGVGLEHFSSLIKAYVDSHGTQVPTIVLMPQQVVSVEPPSFRLTDSQYNIMATTNFARIDCSNIGMEDILLMFERDAGSQYIYSHPSQAGIDGVYVDKTTKIVTLQSLVFSKKGEIFVESEQFIDDDTFELTDEQEYQLGYNDFCTLYITYPDETDKNYIMFSGTFRLYGFNNECLAEIKQSDNAYYIEEYPIGGGGEPTAYIKSASVSNNSLTLTNKDDSTVTYTPVANVPNASDATVGGITIRCIGTALYIRNDGGRA